MTYFHPERTPALPARRREAARRQLEELVARSTRSRGRRGPLLIAAAVIVVVVGTGAAGLIAFRPVTNKGLARCYTVANPYAGPAYYATIAQAGTPTTNAQVDNARQGCAALFRSGLLIQGRRVVRGRRVAPPPSHRGYPVPKLAVCVRNGAAVVFPGRADTCARLGLPAAARRLLRLTPPAAWYGGPGSLSQTGAAVP